MTWQINTKPKDFIEIYNFCEGGGPIIRCYIDGSINLSEVPNYGGEETDHGFFSTVNAAMEFCKDWT